VPGTPNWHRN